MHTSSWWASIWKALANEQGQIPASLDPPSAAEPGEDASPEPAPLGEPGATPAHEDTFFDPSQLAPELQTQWKRMQGAYTKRMQQFSRAREAAEVVERFNSDPEFARHTILSRAQQLGLNLAQPGTHPPGMATGAQPQMPAQLVDAVKSNLSPELQWMAPALAASQWAGMQMALQPIKEQQAQTLRSTRDQQYEQLAEQLSEKAPGWEAHEDDMDNLLTFLQSPNMTDRRWGSKLDLLYKLTAGEGHATAEAARRMGQAGRHRNPAGAPMATPMPNIAEQVRKPKHNQDAWDVAAKFAMAELSRHGIKVS